MIPKSRSKQNKYENKKTTTTHKIWKVLDFSIGVRAVTW